MDSGYVFDGEIWLHQGSDPWHFVTLPQDLSDEIDEKFGGSSPGFGSIRVEVSIGGTTWKTSLFPSKEAAAYVLPIKANVRAVENITAGDRVTVGLSVL